MFYTLKKNQLLKSDEIKNVLNNYKEDYRMRDTCVTLALHLRRIVKDYVKTVKRLVNDWCKECVKTV